MVVYDIPVKVEGSFPGAHLNVYLIENSDELWIKEHPLVLLCPGGGYERTSDREADPLAFRFLAMGYHVAILRYSCAPAVYPTALLELAWSMKMLHEKAAEWHVAKDRIVVAGCSAGGHLAASLGMFWHEEWLAKKTGCRAEDLKPAGMLLCYPVITSGKLAHRGSFEALLAGQYTEEMLERVSLEKQVSEYTPPAFLWHTYTDDCVPVENSLLLIEAMKRYQIPVEFHMYPTGGHGLSAADESSMDMAQYGVQKECQSWLPLAKNWLEGLFLDKCI
ncbi:MAG: alpha/beta hydrolase [Lachnospiraceae bacterium]|nr:alpha/beta hydrolase [Lachnospiraceae bacterium]